MLTQKSFTTLNFRFTCFLVGLEGGFVSQEIGFFNFFPFMKSVSLAPRILRAETAALAAVTCYQALVGDWKVFG
ncbi:MAG: 16S rRNA (uracil(1498)-N(3))-methyltransferase [Candidatus Paracaedibacter sp.]